MQTFKMQNKDLLLSNHNLVLLNDRETLKQRISNRLALFLGEFSLEPELGVDWFRIKDLRYNTEEISKIISRELLKDSEIISIINLEINIIDSAEKIKEFNLPRRTVLFKFKLNTVYGELEGSNNI